MPILYEPKYNSNKELIEIEAISSDIPKEITKQTWKQNTLSHSTVITPESAWPGIHMVEVVRSCPELCRFCLASYLNLPFRNSSLDAGLIPAIEKGFAITKRIGLLGASITQHPEFEDLLDWLNKDYFDGMRLSLSSVRASTVNKKMTELLARRNAKSITIAIESGSKRIREMINKKLTEEEIYSAARYAKEGGLSSLKLYGMVGLPTESDEDIEATADLLMKIKRKTSGLRLVLGVSTFVPKAHTPFQWFGVRTEAKKRLKLLRKSLQSNAIEIRTESYSGSIIQALISRGDRRLAPVIELVRRSQNNIGGWKKAYKEVQEKNIGYKSSKQLPPWEEIVHTKWQNDRILPWRHIQGPLILETLIKHQESV
ncbi:hypothetical protein EV06_1573 [Prochlorococcus sp. MIT 0602]|nr:hypothetical protein EV06_1573 [Prochlorococcus sp. MIT 0602]KGG16059.1 hypothetical protein EV07_2027 [Prochlorococcus sp. MIT 0603]